MVSAAPKLKTLAKSLAAVKGVVDCGVVYWGAAQEADVQVGCVCYCKVVGRFKVQGSGWREFGGRAEGSWGAAQQVDVQVGGRKGEGRKGKGAGGGTGRRAGPTDASLVSSCHGDGCRCQRLPSTGCLRCAAGERASV